MESTRVKSGREKYAFAGMVFGIAAIPLLYPWPLSAASAIIGLILSLIGIRSSRRRMAIVGLTCSAICLIVIAILTVQEFFFMAPMPK